VTKAPRVVSLVPSVTETLLAWDVVPVAVTRFCEAPGVLTVGGTKNPDLAAIQALTPDLVVVDKEENRLGDAEWLEANGMVLHVTHVRTLDDVEPTLTALARAVGRSAEVPSPAPPGLQTALQTTPPDVERVRAWVPIWRRPWMSISAATYGSSILAAAGIDNVCADAADPYPRMTLEEAAGLGPDVVLAPSEPYAFGERHRTELETVAPLIFVDGQDLFWWGSRTLAALARLRQLRQLAVGLSGR
jgi:ABC-type Fe3+-hydroxamate transport system substrate-binding protein